MDGPSWGVFWAAVAAAGAVAGTAGTWAGAGWARRAARLADARAADSNRIATQSNALSSDGNVAAREAADVARSAHGAAERLQRARTRAVLIRQLVRQFRDSELAKKPGGLRKYQASSPEARALMRADIESAEYIAPADPDDGPDELRELALLDGVLYADLDGDGWHVRVAYTD